MWARASAPGWPATSFASRPRSYRAICLDAWSLPGITDPDLYSPDRVHPNSRGHQLMAAAFADKLAPRSSAQARRGSDPLAADGLGCGAPVVEGPVDKRWIDGVRGGDNDRCPVDDQRILRLLPEKPLVRVPR